VVVQLSDLASLCSHAILLFIIGSNEWLMRTECIWDLANSIVVPEMV